MLRHKQIQRGLTAIAGCATLLLGACATTPATSTCATTAWFATGIEDGARGLPQSQLTLHEQICALEDARVDTAAYLQGRDEGLDRYCTMANGMHIGKAGSGYAGVCPAGLEYYFLTGFRMGSEMHRLQNVMRANGTDSERLQEQLDTLHAEAHRVIVQQPYSVTLSAN